MPRKQRRTQYGLTNEPRSTNEPRLRSTNPRDEPDYEHGKGRIIAYDDVPILKNVYDNFPTFFGRKGTNLKGEGNYYYDIRKCGIGFHGDTERRKVQIYLFFAEE